MIDFHCHLDLYPDPQGVTRNCVARNIYILSVTTTPSAWKGTAALAGDAPRIRTALGLHPQIAHQRKGELQLFEQLLPEVRYVGEIGLDGSPECRQYWPDQDMIFTRILRLCELAGGRIMTLHSRRATTPVLDALEAHPGAGTPILHWFSGTRRELERAINLGCWFSIGPAMLTGQKGQALVAKMPWDRVLTESDGPFAQVDGQVLFPWHVDQAIKILASLWDISEPEVQQQLMNNLRTLVSE